MTPEEKQLLIDVNDKLSILIKSDRYIFQKLIQMFDGRNIQLGKETGTIIGTEITQKLAFFGTKPVVQQGSISDPTGGATVDAEARTAINALIDAVQAFGLIA